MVPVWGVSWRDVVVVVQRLMCRACWADGQRWALAVTGRGDRRQVCADHLALYGIVELWVEARFTCPIPEGCDVRTVACPCGEEHDVLGQYPGADHEGVICGTGMNGGVVHWSRLTLIDRWVKHLFPMYEAAPLTLGEVLEDMGAETAFYARVS
jgi:hypothetical protein